MWLEQRGFCEDTVPNSEAAGLAELKKREKLENARCNRMRRCKNSKRHQDTQEGELAGQDALNMTLNKEPWQKLLGNIS